ncbi:tensin-4 [Hyla sarda]|uniref:tensin-4 n=1 Tax=Hyla sarda TaxID=327740 RepID=UPI0024C2C34F|nr:tensin-4 [Hyla sarda]XP_056403884.1 tensin-4 [Hyla sarda]XP_056403885.1 tensin-4 [Hyla sarda]
MSQVIPNHVLRVGQTVCMAPKDESSGFRQVVHPKGIPLTSKCSYYTSETYVSQMTSQVRLADTNLYGEQESMKTHQPLPGNTGIKSVNVKQPSEAEICNGGDPLSPSLDISIDNLNQLILQLDPTFQPLPVNSDLIKKRRDPSPCRPVTSKVTSPPEVKCVGINPPRVVCHQENMQRSSSPTPRQEGILIARGTQSENISPNGSLIFSEPQSHVLYDHYQRPLNGGSHQATETIAIPRKRSNQQNQVISTSYGSDSTYQTRPSFRTSEASMMSTSPGSDTSYVLGSTHSLQYDDTDGHFHSRLLESPFGSQGSFSNLFSPVNMSPAPHINYSDHNGSFGHFKTSHTSTKSHANSCPPSVNNSAMDIPILLVNGCHCPENEDISPKSSRQLHGGNKRRGSSSFNKTSSESSIPTCTDSNMKDGQPGMKFVMDTSKQWFKPNFTRDQAIELLKDKEPGTFIIRDSTSYRGCFGLAVKAPGAPSGNVTNELVRHFLIESSAKGVHVKGASEEPHFGSLPALVYQHTITPLSLPCKLLVPPRAHNDSDSSPDTSPEGACELRNSAACNVLYLNSVSTETLTGSSAIQKAVTTIFERADHIVPTIVNFKAADQGVTLTDIQRKVFFRRHYPVSTLSFCSVDPEHRKWQKQCRPSRIFGFVAKNPTDPSDNVCHIFAEYDAIQPASPLISCLTSLIQQQERV